MIKSYENLVIENGHLEALNCLLVERIDIKCCIFCGYEHYVTQPK